jgi:hypothetical protein
MNWRIHRKCRISGNPSLSGANHVHLNIAERAIVKLFEETSSAHKESAKYSIRFPPLIWLPYQ